MVKGKTKIMGTDHFKFPGLHGSVTILQPCMLNFDIKCFHSHFFITQKAFCCLNNGSVMFAEVNG